MLVVIILSKLKRMGKAQAHLLCDRMCRQAFVNISVPEEEEGIGSISEPGWLYSLLRRWKRTSTEVQLKETPLIENLLGFGIIFTR